MRKGLGIVAQVDLAHGRLCRGIELQLDDIQMAEGLHHDVDPAAGRMHLYIRPSAQQAEDDAEHLLVVTLILRVISVGYGGEEVLEEMQHLVHVAVVQGLSHVAERDVGPGRVGRNIIKV